jgi:hypothetical protein
MQVAVFATREKPKEPEKFSLTLRVMAASKKVKPFVFQHRHRADFPRRAD